MKIPRILKSKAFWGGFWDGFTAWKYLFRRRK